MGCKAGKLWYNNGNIEIKCFECDQPANFIRGRLPFSNEAKLKMSESGKEVQARSDIKENNKNKHIELWKDKQYRDKVIKAQHEGWTIDARKAQAEKITGYKHSFETKLKHSIDTKSRWKDAEYRKRMSNMSHNLWLDQTYRDKHYNALKNNNTFNSSKVEDDMYDFLCKMYPYSEVKRDYNEDPRYPFMCDFYIVSCDLFIELNAHWTHGPHEFDETNEEDIKLLELWRSKQDYLPNGKKNSYFIAEDVWTLRDKKKIETARKNKLNYCILYKEGAYFI